MNGKAQEQTAKSISLEKIKILILLELAQRIYSCHCKKPPKSSKCLTVYIFGPCDINFSKPDQRKANGKRARGADSSFSETSQPCTAFHPPWLCWQTAPLFLVHLLQKTLPSNSNQCWISPSPFSWRLKHRSKVLFASTFCLIDHIRLFIFLLVRKENPQLRPLDWRVRKVWNSSTGFFGTYWMKKNSLTAHWLYLLILFHSAILELISATSWEMKAVSMNYHSKCRFTRDCHETQKANDFQEHA